MAFDFYGEAQAAIHDERFGDLARDAAAALVAALHAAGIAEGTVVELGCGSGIAAAIFVDAGFQVDGCDLSPAMVQLATTRAPEARLRVGSVYDHPLPYCVAVAAIGEVLCYRSDSRSGIEQLRALLARVHERLLPGGVVLFDVATPGRNGDLATTRHHEGPGWVLDCRITEDAPARRLVREIVIQLDAEPERAVLERHELTLFEADDVLAAVRDAGFAAVEVRDSYGGAPSTSTPTGGWLVVEAHRR